MQRATARPTTPTNKPVTTAEDLAPRQRMTATPERRAPARTMDMGRGTGGIKRWLRRALAPLWFRFLIYFPIPAEIKWHQMLNFIGTLTISYYQDLVKTMPEEEALKTVTNALLTSGRRWMWDAVDERGGLTPTPGALADLLNIVFRTLSIESSVQVHGDRVTVTSHRCPYLELATKRNIEGEKICTMICAAKSSFVEGLSHGFPCYIRYQPEAMMGLQHKTCVKHFTGVFKKS